MNLPNTFKAVAAIGLSLLTLSPATWAQCTGAVGQQLPLSVNSTSKLQNCVVSGFYQYTNPGGVPRPTKYKKSSWTGNFKLYYDPAHPDLYVIYYFGNGTSPTAPGTWTFHTTDLLSTVDRTRWGPIGSPYLPPSLQFTTAGVTMYAVILNTMDLTGTSAPPQGIVITATSVSYKTDKITPAWAGANGYPLIQWDVSESLDTESTFSDDEAIARAPVITGKATTAYRTDYANNWTPPGRRNNPSDQQVLGTNFDIQNAKFTATIQPHSVCNGTYKVYCNYTQWLIGTPRPNQPNPELREQIFNPDPESGGLFQVVDPDQQIVVIGGDGHDVALRTGYYTEITSVTAERVDQPASCSLGAPGAQGKPEVKSVDFSLSLGATPTGYSAGYFNFSADQVTAALYSPDALLNNYSIDGSVTFVKDTTGKTLQVFTPQGLVDVTLNSGSPGYQLNIYHSGQVGPIDSGTQRYTVSGSPYLTYLFENPDQDGSATKLRITETRDGTTKVTLFANDDSGGVAMTTGNGTRVEQVDYSYINNNSNRVQVRQIFDSAGTLYSRTTSYSDQKPFGLVPTRTEQQIDSTGSTLVSTTTYYEDLANDGAAYGQIKLQINPDNSWSQYMYDTQGRVTMLLQPFGNSEPTTDQNQCRSTETDYSTMADGDGDGQPEQLVTTINRVLGVEVGRSYRVKWSSPVTLGSDLCTKFTNIQCTVAGAAKDASSNLVTTSYTYANGIYAGQDRMVINPDNTGTITTNALDSNGNRITTTLTGALSGDQSTVIAGSKRVSTQNLLSNREIEQETYDIATNLLQDLWTATSFDDYGRPTRIDYSDGTFVTQSYACCGLASLRDRQGLVTTYNYDVLGRVQSTTHAGITLISTYDPAGRVTAVNRQGADGSTNLMQSTAYDLAGRKTSSQDAEGRPTNYIYYGDSQQQNVRTTTNPDGGTIVETYARDGTLVSRTGSAVAASLKYYYGTDQSGFYTQEVHVNGEAESEWIKTYVDAAGRNSQIVYPDGATAYSYYNALGQLARTIDPDGVQTLYDYDMQGRQSVTAIDVNGNGTIDYDGPDRVIRSTQDVATKGTTIVLRTTTQTWLNNGDTAPITVGVTESTPSGNEFWQTAYGRTSHTLISDDGDGGRIVTTTSPDSSVELKIYAQDLLQSDTRQDANGIVISSVTNTYDANNRLHIRTVVGQGATTYTYYNDDRIQSVTTPDPDSNRSGSGYDPQMTFYTYDGGGRVNHIVAPDGTNLYQQYYPSGLLQTQYGERTSPISYFYDTQGRIIQLHTWQKLSDFNNNSNFAVTAWDYDSSRGWLVHKRYPGDQGPIYQYTPAGRLHVRNWQRGVNCTYSYSGAGDLTGIVYSDATPAVTFGYDRAGRITTTTDAAGSCTSTYTIDGQLQNESYAGGLLDGFGINRMYDTVGRLGSLTPTAGPSVTYAYDSVSRLQSITSGANTVTYGYTPITSLIQSVAWVDSGGTSLTNNRTYDALNRLTTMTYAMNGSHPATRSYAYTYDGANQRTKAVREDSSYWAYGYDNFGQVTSGRRYLATGDQILGRNLGYAFDAIGNRLSTNANGYQSGYSPNNLNQYTQRTVPGAVDVSGVASSGATVTVTPGGGIPQPTQRQGSFFDNTSLVNNAVAPQLLDLTVTAVKNQAGADGEDAIMTASRQAFVPQTPESFTYDTDGNLTQDGRWTYEWDAENRLLAMQTLPAVATMFPALNHRLEFKYDAVGRRIAKKVSNWSGSVWVLAGETFFLYDGWNALAEIDALNSNTLIRSYAWGLDLSGTAQGAGGAGGLILVASGSSTSAPLYDGNGNITAWINCSDSSLLGEAEYGPYGEPIAVTGLANSIPYGFSTQYTDTESGSLYYGHRYYSPSSGRWLSKDPITEQGGFNLYAFVANSPINAVDVLGLKFAFGPTATDEFIAKFNAIIARLKQDSPRLNRMITDLETTSLENLVIPYQKNFVDSNGETIENSTYGNRQEGGSNTKIHLNLDKEGCDEILRKISFDELVAHELFHAWSYNNLFGKYLDEVNPLTGIERDEEWAVRYQNLVPHTDGGRTVYGKKHVPGTSGTVQEPNYFSTPRP